MNLEELDERLLDDFSGRFSTALFAAHPGWKSLAKMDRNAESSSHSLVVVVQAPEAAHAAHPLAVYTDNEEVTVAFDHYHLHFDWPSFDEEHGNPLKFISDLLQERLAVASVWMEDRWAGSQILSAGDGPEGLRHVPAGADRAVIRSWHGTLNAEYRLPLG